MINVDFQVLFNPEVFVLAPCPLPSGNGRFQQTTTNGNNMQCGRWMKRQERVEQRKRAQMMPEAVFGLQVSFFFSFLFFSILTIILCYIQDVIAICAKVWNRVNLSIFASSEAESCSTSIAMTRCSIFIILVVSESPH